MEQQKLNESMIPPYKAALVEAEKSAATVEKYQMCIRDRAWFKSEFLYPKRLVFKSDSLYCESLKDAIAQGEKPPHRRKNRKPQPPAGKEQ